MVKAVKYNWYRWELQRRKWTGRRKEIMGRGTREGGGGQEKEREGGQSVRGKGRMVWKKRGNKGEEKREGEHKKRKNTRRGRTQGGREHKEREVLTTHACKTASGSKNHLLNRN